MQVLSPGSHEHVVYSGRQTPFVLVPRFVIAFGSISLLWWYVAKGDLWDWSLAAVALSCGLLLIFTPYWALWRRERFLLTNRTVRNTHYISFFKKQVLDAPLERILNVGYKTTGPISVLLNFGNVEIQVVGLTEPIIFRNVSKPKRIYELAWKLHQQALKEKKLAFPPEYLQERIGYQK